MAKVHRRTWNEKISWEENLHGVLGADVLKMTFHYEMQKASDYCKTRPNQLDRSRMLDEKINEMIGVSNSSA